MIHEVHGDILLTKAQAIAHGVSPGDHFAHGLALALREKFPVMAKDFRHYARQCHPRPGEMWEWGGVGGVRVFCLMTQDDDTGRGGQPGPATAAAVAHCLKRLRHALDGGGVTGLALPRLATGVGGLAWEAVYPLIKKHLADSPVPVYVYTKYEQGVAAHEPH